MSDDDNNRTERWHKALSNTNGLLEGFIAGSIGCLSVGAVGALGFGSPAAATFFVVGFHSFFQAGIAYGAIRLFQNKKGINYNEYPDIRKSMHSYPVKFVPTYAALTAFITPVFSDAAKDKTPIENPAAQSVPAPVAPQNQMSNEQRIVQDEITRQGGFSPSFQPLPPSAQP